MRARLAAKVSIQYRVGLTVGVSGVQMMCFIRHSSLHPADCAKEEMVTFMSQLQCNVSLFHTEMYIQYIERDDLFCMLNTAVSCFSVGTGIF